MKLKVGDYVRLKNFHELKGVITWMDTECDSEGRVVHIEQDGETYRSSESSIELVFPE